MLAEELASNKQSPFDMEDFLNMRRCYARIFLGTCVS